MVDDHQLSPLLTVKEVSSFLHIHKNTLRRWNTRGILKAYRVGLRGDRRFQRKEVTHFLSKLHKNRGHVERL